MDETNQGEILVVCNACGGQMTAIAGEVGTQKTCIHCGAPFFVPIGQSLAPDAPGQAASPSSRRQSFVEGVALVKQLNYQDALRLLEPLQREKDEPQLSYAIGYCYYKLRDFSQAREALDRAKALGSQEAGKMLERLDAKLPDLAGALPVDAKERPAPGGGQEDSAAAHAREAAYHVQKLVRKGVEASAPLFKRAGEMAVSATAEVRKRLAESAKPRIPTPAGSAPAFAPAVGTASPAADSFDRVFPWDICPEAVARATAHEQSGDFHPYNCKCNEVLHNLAKDGATGPGIKAQLNVYPDMVGVTGRPIGCLMRLLLLLLWLPSLILAGPMYILGLIMIVVVAIFFLMFLISHPVYGILALIFIGGPIVVFGFLFRVVMVRWYVSLANLIRRDPRRPLAIVLLFKFTPFIPRYWRPGEIVQVIRADIHRFLCGSRSIILFVQDTPLGNRAGCLDSIAVRFPLYWFMARRRIYFVWPDRGREEADRAAEEAARVLGVNVLRGVFTQKGLQIP